MGNTIDVPHSGCIPGGLHVGSEIVVKGWCHLFGDRFSVSLCQDYTYDAGCALHFKPCFKEKKVARTHKCSGAWGPEENAGSMVFRRNYRFDLHVKVTQDGYAVAVNGKHFCTFQHRLPVEKVQFIYIEGDVSITSIGFHGGPRASTPAYPTVLYSGPSSSSAGRDASGTQSTSFISKIEVPHSERIRGRIDVGTEVAVKGRIRVSAKWFSINLLCGPTFEEDCAFCFETHLDKNEVVRRHKQDGQWGADESDGCSAFSRGMDFDVHMKVKAHEYEVTVDGEEICTFQHRLPFKNVRYIYIAGDVEINKIQYN